MNQSPSSQYWKISPGENAWQWDECLAQGFIALGWNDLGDLSTLSHSEFKAHRDRLIADKPEQKLTTHALNQAWVFSNIQKGDRIIVDETFLIDNY